MNDATLELRKVLLKLFSPDASPKAAANYLTRKLICTPYQGNYGTLAGWIVCVEGSPPKGTLVFAENGAVCYFHGATAKAKFGERQMEVLRNFFKQRLKKAPEAAFVIDDANSN